MKFNLKSVTLYFLVFILHPLIGDTSPIDLHLMNPKKNWELFFRNLNTVYPMDTFIESGTYLGHTSAKAALCFDTVYTIELNDDFYLQAKDYLKKYPNAHIYHGSTTEIFPDLIPLLAQQNKKPVFWLDGHFMSCMQDVDTSPNNLLPSEYTPIMQELQIIMKNNLKEGIILIDDIRLFGSLLQGKRIERAGNIYYPLLSETCKLLDINNFSYQIVGDILLAYKNSMNISFSPVIKACTISRLYDGTNYDYQAVLDSEQIIATAMGEELLSINELYKDFSKPWKSWCNKSPHYNLWYGLTLQHAGKHQEACSQFDTVQGLGYNHWRVSWYLAKSLYQINDIEGTITILKTIINLSPEFEPAIELLKKLKQLD